MKFQNLPEYKTNMSLVKDNKCLIDGEEYPLFYNRILSMIDDETQPIILFPADQGHGKTFALSRLAEVFHEELDILSEDFNPELQITQDSLEFVRRVRNNRKKMFIFPDADSKIPSNEYYSASNMAHRSLVYLSRIFSNILCYDTHEMSSTDKAIRTNHNIRITTLENQKYTYKVERIIRKSDTQHVEIEKKNAGLWSPDLPSEETRERIKELDEEKKVESLKKREDAIIEERNDGDSDYSDLF